MRLPLLIHPTTLVRAKASVRPNCHISIERAKNTMMRSWLDWIAVMLSLRATILNLGAVVLVYLVPPVVVFLVRWLVTGDTMPNRHDGLFILLGVWTLYTLFRRRFKPEILPLL
jgi:hypothetical protein